jgi:prepilin-type processing-associated H-X9-DG protein
MGSSDLSVHGSLDVAFIVIFRVDITEKPNDLGQNRGERFLARQRRDATDASARSGGWMRRKGSREKCSEGFLIVISSTSVGCGSSIPSVSVWFVDGHVVKTTIALAIQYSVLLISRFMWSVLEREYR